MNESWKDIGERSGIYKIINKLNNNYYVGSSQTILKRVRTHVVLLNKNQHPNLRLQRAWNKYGIDMFQVQIVDTCSIDQLLQIEQQYLNFAKINRKSVYNMSFDATSPMRGRCHSQKTKDRMGKSHIGEKCHWFGIKKSEKHCKMLSELAKLRVGEKNHFYGKHHSSKTIEHLKQIHIGKISPNRRPVIAENGDEVHEFVSVTHATLSIHGTKPNIRKAIKNKSLYHGYKWRYKNS
jgi:group I intron endonuclease